MKYKDKKRIQSIEDFFIVKTKKLKHFNKPRCYIVKKDYKECVQNSKIYLGQDGVIRNSAYAYGHDSSGWYETEEEIDLAFSRWLDKRTK